MNSSIWFVRYSQAAKAKQSTNCWMRMQYSVRIFWQIWNSRRFSILNIFIEFWIFGPNKWFPGEWRKELYIEFHTELKIKWLNKRPQNDKNANHILWGRHIYGIPFGSAAHNGTYVCICSVSMHTQKKNIQKISVYNTTNILFTFDAHTAYMQISRFSFQSSNANLPNALKMHMKCSNFCHFWQIVLHRW